MLGLGSKMSCISDSGCLNELYAHWSVPPPQEPFAPLFTSLLAQFHRSSCFRFQTTSRSSWIWRRTNSNSSTSCVSSIWPPRVGQLGTFNEEYVRWIVVWHSIYVHISSIYGWVHWPLFRANQDVKCGRDHSLYGAHGLDYIITLSNALLQSLANHLSKPSYSPSHYHLFLTR